MLRFPRQFPPLSQDIPFPTGSRIPLASIPKRFSAVALGWGLKSALEALSPSFHSFASILLSRS